MSFFLEKFQIFPDSLADSQSVPRVSGAVHSSHICYDIIIILSVSILSVGVIIVSLSRWERLCLTAPGTRCPVVMVTLAGAPGKQGALLLLSFSC